ncbi:MAG: hypothetical protein M3S32_07225 [Acidobacteriota bacterium]|nr:hypothetical protein [Acidobacteriota bacterium]
MKNIVLDMFRSGWRRATGIYLSLFFLAVTGARHQHVNGLEDLLLDQRSDSGQVLKFNDADFNMAGPVWSADRVVDDDPCLACFNNDFVSATSPIVVFTPHLERFDQSSRDPAERAPRALLRETPSRAPPALS